MKKLALRLDELRVDSFDTSFTQPDRRGTVRGRDSYTWDEGPMCWTLQEYSCNPCAESSIMSCGGTCGGDYTCEQTCGGGTCDPVWINTVLYHTQEYSCGGSCGTCGGTDCYT